MVDADTLTNEELWALGVGYLVTNTVVTAAVMGHTNIKGTARDYSPLAWRDTTTRTASRAWEIVPRPLQFALETIAHHRDPGLLVVEYLHPFGWPNSDRYRGAFHGPLERELT